jgi:hypothetical protein
METGRIEMGTITIGGVQYDTNTGAKIESNTTDQTNKTLSNDGIPVSTEVESKENIPVGNGEGTTVLKTKITPTASPISVLGQFTHSFIEALVQVPDTVVMEVAQELSDSLNLGWSDSEIFQFSEFVNKGKVTGDYYIGVENPSLNWMFPQPVDDNIKRILETQGRDAAIEAMEVMGIPRNKFENAAAIAGDFAAISALVYGGGSVAGVPRAFPKGMSAQDAMALSKQMPPGLKKANEIGSLVVNDMMQFIRTNPGKAALFDLMGAGGYGYGAAEVADRMTPEFRKNHPFLASLFEMGIPLVTSAGGPFAIIGANMLLTKGPVGWTVKFVGDKAAKLAALGGNKYLQRKLIRQMQSQLDSKVAKQLKPFFEAIMNNPDLALNQNMAMVIRSDIVGGEAVSALKNNIRQKIIQDSPDMAGDAAALELEVMNRMFTLGAADEVTEDMVKFLPETFEKLKSRNDTITLLKGNKSTDGKIIYEEVQVPVGPFSSAALEAYEQQLHTLVAGNGWKNVPEFSTRMMKPEPDELSDWILNKLYKAKVQLSMAEQSQDKNLISLQQKLEATAAGDELNLLQDRKNSNVQINKSFWDAILPTSKEEPSFIFNILNKDVLALNQELIAAEEAMLSAQKGITSGEPILSGAEILSANIGLREKLISLRKAVINDFRKGDKEIRELKLNVPQNKWNDFQTSIKNLIFEGADDATKLPIFKDEASVPPIIQKIMQKGEELTFSDMMDLYVRIGDDLFDATLAKSTMITSRGRKNLYLVKKQFEKFLEKEISQLSAGGIWRQGDVYDGVQALLAGVPEGTLIPRELVGKAKNVALKNYFDQYKKQVGDIFDKNAAYRVQRYAEHGNYFTPDEYFIHEFFKTADDVKQYLKVFGEDPEAVKQLTNTLLDEIRKSAYNRQTGLLDTNKVTKWMEKNSAKLTHLPNFNKLLQDENALLTSATQRVATLNARKKVVDQTLLSKELRKISLQMADTDPAKYGELMNYNVSKLINSALDNPNLMTQLYKRIRFDKNSELAFKQLIWQKIGDRVNLENIPKLQAFLKDEKIAKSLEMIFNKNELKMLQKLQDSYQIIMTTAFPKGEPMTANPIIQNITTQLGTSPQSLTSVIRAMREGRISPMNTFIYLGSRMLSKQQLLNFRKIYIEGLSNPDILDKVIRHKMSVSLFDAAPKKDIDYLNRLLFGIGIKPIGGLLGVKPEIIIPNEGTMELDQDILKWLKDKEKQEKLFGKPEERSSMNVPSINPASQLSQGVEMNDIMEMVSKTPSGTKVTEEQFASYFPHDTTGQMIAARGAAEGGIMNATPKTRQRII